jgi:hypothetical protein
MDVVDEVCVRCASQTKFKFQLQGKKLNIIYILAYGKIKNVGTAVRFHK